MVHFFCSILSSPPECLGWDMTMTPVQHAGALPQYDFTVEDSDGTQTRYRSLDLISSAQSEKGTRVWRVVELRDDVPCGDPLILKDVWRHAELAPEGSNIDSIRSNVMSEDERHFLDEHLPTVVHHGDVIIHPQSSGDPPHLDVTQTHARNFQALCRGEAVDSPSLLAPGTRLGPYFGTGLRKGKPELRGRKIHYRIVFKEDCSPIHREKSPSTVFNALADVAEGRPSVIASTHMY